MDDSRLSIPVKYKAIFEREIATPANDLFRSYDPVTNTHTFQAHSHNCDNCSTTGCSADCHKKLGELMWKNLVFYCYGEDEIVDKINSGLFSNLTLASRTAYNERLPKRDPKKDGVPGEVLLDMLVQLHQPNAYKLAVRHLLRQNDNNEIKGYDLTYFASENGQISIWLGQAKMGERDYCLNGIHRDLTAKFKDTYLSKQIFFIADKQIGTTLEAKEITTAICKLNELSARESKSDQKRATALIQHFNNNGISIVIPCLLAYGKGTIYSDISKVKEAIEDELKLIQAYYQRKTYTFDNFAPQIVFYVFPLKDLGKLRMEGFYAGLYQHTS